MKHRLSTREIRGNGAQGISRGLRLFFTLYPDLSHYTDFLLMEELILCIGMAIRAIFFPYCPLDEAIQVRIVPVENSVVAALGNTHVQESNTRRVKFQYYPF